MWSYSASDHEANFAIVKLKITFQPIMLYVWTHSRGPFHFVLVVSSYIYLYNYYNNIFFSAIKHVLYPFGISISFQFLGTLSFYLQRNVKFHFTTSLKYFFSFRFAFILYLFQLDWKRIVNEMSFVNCHSWMHTARTSIQFKYSMPQSSWRKLFLCSFSSGCRLLIVVVGSFELSVDGEWGTDKWS